MSSPSTPSELPLSAAARAIYDDILGAMNALEGPFVTSEEYQTIMADLQRRCAEQAAIAAERSRN